LAALTGNNVS